MRKLKKLPRFKTEDEEREFWASHDSADYFDWSQAKRVRFPNLKPSTQTISIRLPQHMLEDLKVLANKHDVPYQSFIKLMLNEKLEEKKRKPLQHVKEMA